MRTHASSFSDLTEVLQLQHQITESVQDLAGRNRAAAKALIAQLAQIMGVTVNGESQPRSRRTAVTAYDRIANLFIGNQNQPLTKQAIVDASQIIKGTVVGILYKSHGHHFHRHENPNGRETLFSLTPAALKDALARAEKELEVEE